MQNRSNANRKSCQCTTKSGCLPYLFAGPFEGYRRLCPILHLAKGHFVLLCKINDMGEEERHLCGCDGLRHPIAIFIVNGAPKLEIKICRKAKRPQNRTKKIERRSCGCGMRNLHVCSALPCGRVQAHLCYRRQSAYKSRHFRCQDLEPPSHRTHRR